LRRSPLVGADLNFTGRHGWPQDRPVSRLRSPCLLDTNIIGNVTMPVRSEALVAWMAEQADEDLFISSLTVAEIRRGLLEKRAGKKRRELERWFSVPRAASAARRARASFRREGRPYLRAPDGRGDSDRPATEPTRNFVAPFPVRRYTNHSLRCTSCR